MFGYVRPLREALEVREFDNYLAMYCGLCHMVGKRGGFTARMFLNYDFTFLAMLLAPRETRPRTCSRRCPAKLGMREKRVCADSPGLETAADESIILAYWRLRDTILDEGILKGLAARFLSLLLRRSYRKAAAARPEFDLQVKDGLNKLHRLEQENSPSLDRTADTFACILRAAAPCSGNTARDRAVGQLLYHVGRWIYLVDAWDDLKDDLTHGRYNPIHARFEGREEVEQEYLRTTLRHSLNLAVSAFGLLDLGCWSGVVENILCRGLPMVEELVFCGEWKGTSLHRPIKSSH